jgi:hypothetical protein
MLCRVLCLVMFVVWTAEYAPEEKTAGLIYGGLWQSPFALLAPLVRGLPLIRLSPVHLTLLALVPLVLLQSGASRRRSWPLELALVGAVGGLATGFAWGVVRGGSAYQGYVQIGRLLVALLLAFLLPHTIRSAKHVRLVLLTVLAAALARATLVVYAWYRYMRGRPLDVEFVTGHEDSLLFAAAFVIIVAWALDRWRVSSWLLAAPPLVLLLWAVLLNARRIAWIEIVVACAFAALLLPWRRKKQLALLGLAATPVLAVYVIVGTGRPEPVFAPLDAFATAGSVEDTSSLARLEEIQNLLHTYRGHPLLGTGWGHPYVEISSIYTHFDPRIGFQQYGYLPHNSLLALLAFGGLPGFLGVWLVVPVAAYLASRAYRAAERRAERVAASAAFAILPAYSVHCYGDVGLYALNVGFLLAVALGLASSVAARTGAWPGLRADEPEEEEAAADAGLQAA